MSSSEDSEQQSTPISAEDNTSSAPMRKFRIFAGLLTIFVGFQTLYALVMAANLYLYNNLLVDLLRFTSTLMAPSFGITIPIPAVIILLVLVIGGLVFCGKKGRARSTIWLAALITVPASFWIISLNAYIPGRRPPDPDYLSIIISLLISIYLIWVLWKSSPKKMFTLKNLGIVTLIAGFVVVMFMVNGTGVQLQKRNGVFYEVNATEPFTGKAVVSRYRNGRKKTEGNFVNGKQDGLFLQWYKNGQKGLEGNFSKGKQEGIFTEWHISGEKKKEASLFNGKQDGLFLQWYKNGQKRAEGNFSKGQKDGVFTQWYENGQKRDEMNFVNNKKEGVETLWHENGQKKDEMNFVNNIKEGAETLWYESGKKKAEVNYINGKKEGVEPQWYESGKKKAEVNFVNNKKEGVATQWYENGQKKDEMNFVNNRVDGILTLWKENGQKKSVRTFTSGIEHRDKKRNCRNTIEQPNKC